MDYDVIISGGGPVGLMLACELGLHGVRVGVLERLTEIDQTVKAGSVNTPTAEAFYRRGLLPALEEAQAETMKAFQAFMAQQGGAATADQPKVSAFAGHFAALWLLGDLVDENDPDFADRGPAARLTAIRQQDVERVLGERAAELGVDVLRGVELTGFESSADGVVVRAGEREFRCGWLVGCDGGRSTVRRLAGFDFPGTPPMITGHQAIVSMEGAEGLGVGWTHTDTGIYANGPVPGRILTVEFDGPPEDRTTPVTAEELQASLRAVSGVDVTVTGVRSATRFTDNARQATTYRLGRVLLAGDAAHVHSPFGGQGLNLGIGDAVNLGWKLAAVIAGRSPEALLDTYTAERHPIGAWVLDWTRAQVLLMRPEARSRALRAVVSDLIGTTAGTTYFVKRISGVWQRYDLPGGHPMVGRSVPDLELADGTRVADHLHQGRGLLLDLGLDLAADPRVPSLPAKPVDARDFRGLLIRPDGVVAWAGDTPDAALEEALATWF
ncbi:FAD-dependent oxidoreductase [Nonomuraea sp. WAC 01424]|uniref:FAD-dependent monooxygenase n=1 Tax=Nonomuraea sp. WAC 01424 TaxID=2203200 RepID=UPI000F773CFE|nr:FAD-dependent monooxygenase [Nonomuraea sp. WAC 01424]RSM94475.1 FAD-dependent oxidoreductase [Nonomuraea sp. WAC 01424]